MPSWVSSGVWTVNLPILIVMSWPARALSPNIETWSFERVFNIEIFMEKVCRKWAVKLSPIRLFNFGKYPKTVNACKKEIVKKLTWFFHLHTVLFYRQDYEKQKISYKSLWVAKISYQSLFWSAPLNLETGKKRKERDKILN